MKKRSPVIWLIAALIGLTLFLGCSQSTAVSSGTETPVPVTTVIAARQTEPRPPSTATPTTRQVARVTTVIIGVTTPPVETLTASPTFTQTAILSLPSNLSGLKYRLIEQFGNIFFCDPDLYPVAHEVSDQEIAARVAAIRQDAAEYQAILEHLGLPGVTNLSTAQNRQIDAEQKRLNAIDLEPSGAQFAFSLQTTDQQQQGFTIQGTISSEGVITVTSRQPSINRCPICLTGSTLIETPQGALPVRDLAVGMLVWTATSSGNRVLASILRTTRREVPPGVAIVHVILDDGRDIFVSAGHPTFDGRFIGDLSPGDFLDGARVIAAGRVPLADNATYDILPAGPTGTYWANGILLRSTLSVR